MPTKIDLSLILYLHTLKLNLSHIEILRYYKEGTEDFLPARHKLKTELQNLGYIYETITQKGLDLLQEVDNWDGVYIPKEQQVKTKRVYSEDFIRFWNTYPSTDNFEIDGRTFQGIRSLRDKKDECQTKFDFITKIISPQELIDALQYEIDARMDQSLVRGENQISFMKGSWSYLHNKAFEPYLALAAKGAYKSTRKKEEPNNTETVI